jgi:hypothetical protein
MDTIFTLKPKYSIKAFSNNNAMMRLKMQNALIQQELNRVKAANAALAAQQSEHQVRVALAAQQQREHEARVALAAQQQREHEARVALPAQQQVISAPHIKKSKFGKLLSNMNKRN